MTYADETYLSLTAIECLASGTPIMFVDVSCAPRKYGLKIRITRSLSPPEIGIVIGDSPMAVISRIKELADNNFPTSQVRQDCSSYAKKFHSERNAMELLSALL